MSGNTFGEIFRATTFGESHGPALGCVIDGCPAGLGLSAEDIAAELRRRRPGGGGISTSRAEADEPEILSGLFEGKTMGSPIAIVVRNTGQRSEDYDELRDLYRPGHGDWTWEAKYGQRDHRGGGRSSARETLGRVAAGAVAKKFLAAQRVTIRAWTAAAAGISAPGPDEEGFDWEEIERNPLRMPQAEAAQAALEKLEKLRREGDSSGCRISCIVRGIPPGLGEPVFDKLDARIAAAMLSLGSAKGVEFGAGFAASGGIGSEQNDRPIPGVRPDLTTAIPSVPTLYWKTNKAGGVLGGISTGMPLSFTVAFKPVPSIGKKQWTVDRLGNERELVIQGRHDVCIAPRAVPVVEAMTALVLADFLLLRRSSRLRNHTDPYELCTVL
ncbi:MAG: chorismate synthase [Treponema sp.]|jgi:chorismate synthase|nr:chorismate synthase [Treponema sp.]